MKAAVGSLSGRKRAILACVVGALLVIVLIQFVVRPLKAERAGLVSRTGIEEMRLEHNLRQVSPVHAAAVRAKHDRYTAYVGKRVSSAEESAAMLKEIEGAARQFNVTIAGTKPPVARTESSYEEYAVEVEVEGNLQALVEFLYALESSPQLLRVPALVVAPKAEADRSLLKCTMTVTKVALL